LKGCFHDSTKLLEIFSSRAIIIPMITTVTGKNQITIPSEIARETGIKPGTRIDWMVSNDPAELRCIILPAPSSVAKRLRGAGKHLLKPGQDPIAELLVERLAEEAR